MHMSRGLVHNYIGMRMDYSTKGEVKVKVTMVDYLKGVLGDFAEKITGTAPTPASEHMFAVRPDEERTMPNEEQALAFHYIVSRLIFASSRSRKLSRRWCRLKWLTGTYQEQFTRPSY
jgi:hypothetical protein